MCRSVRARGGEKTVNGSTADGANRALLSLPAARLSLRLFSFCLAPIQNRSPPVQAVAHKIISLCTRCGVANYFSNGGRIPNAHPSTRNRILHLNSISPRVVTCYVLWYVINYCLSICAITMIFSNTSDRPKIVRGPTPEKPLASHHHAAGRADASKRPLSAHRRDERFCVLTISKYVNHKNKNCYSSEFLPT